MANFSSYKLESLLAGLFFKRERLIHWLNSNSPAKKRSVRLIEALRELNALADRGDKSDEARRAGLALHLEIIKLKRLLRRTTWALTPSQEMSDGVDNLRGWHLEQSLRGGNAVKILELVASLSEYGLLDSVRRCPCGQWFLAYNRRSKHHSPECKRKFEAAQRKTPEGRAVRRKYMRDLRATKRRMKRKRT